MLGTKELTKNMNMTTARTDTHFTKRTLSVILCCRRAGGKMGRGEKQLLFYRTTVCVCLRRRGGEEAGVIIEIRTAAQGEECARGEV